MRRLAYAVALLTLGALGLAPRTPATAAAPPWLAANAGTAARVEVAPWLVADEPEAALTAGPASLRRDFTVDGTRPEDVVYEPIGVRVRIVHLTSAGRAALVRGIGAQWTAFAPLDRLVPEVPAGTRLRVAGGFGGFADFYPTLATRPARALQIATGSDLVALGFGVAPFDANQPAFVRIHVRVTSGDLAGRSGWIGSLYTGVPADPLPDGAAVAEKACRCRLVQFGRP